MNSMKDHMRSLHSLLTSYADHVKFLQKNVRQITQDYETQKQEIDKASSKQFALNSTAGELKREIVKVCNIIKFESFFKKKCLCKRKD